ncbi:MAG: hypothetical protein Q9191_004459 [Dirinaria sp. TL-2023a]
MPPKNPLHIGFLVLPTVQILDISPVDLFSMLTPSYLSACPLPQVLRNGAIPINITYISPLPSGALTPCTAGASLHIDAGLSSPDVAPGKLEILMVPGPEPKAETSDEVKIFIKRHVDEGAVTLMTVCLGCIPVARAGIFKGGITNGQDMVAAYLRERWPGPTTEAVLAMADVGDRGAEYSSGKAADGVWWLWQIFRGWVFGKIRTD